MIEELFDKSDRRLERLSDEMRMMDRRLASLEQDARQPRLAMEADIKADKEGAAKAVQAKHGDRCTAQRVKTDRSPPPVSA